MPARNAAVCQQTLPPAHDDIADIGGSDTCPGEDCQCGVDVEQFASIRGRAGVLAEPNVLLCGPAGLAAAKVDGYTDQDPGSGRTGKNRTMIGYTAGLGIEGRLAGGFGIEGEVKHDHLGGADFVAVNDITREDVAVDMTTISIDPVRRF